MAEGFLRAIAGDEAESQSAGVSAGGVHPVAVRVMAEAGVDISKHRSKSVAELGSLTFDVVITLCDPARDYCVNFDSSALGEDLGLDPKAKNPVMAGAPLRLHWSIPDPAEAEGSEEEILAAFREARDLVRGRVSAMVEDGYLAALAESRERLAKVLDSLEDGIYVHDEQRRILLFNRAAERITGYSKEEVVGRDCHDVLGQTGLCGSQCRFRDGSPGLVAPYEQEVRFSTRDGDDRRVEMAVSTMAIGAGRPAQVIARIRDVTEVVSLREKLDARRSYHNMIGASPAMQEVFATIRQVAASDYSALVTGESGAGKELAARAIHEESPRKGGPFVPINCGALPDEILESEIFGHVRGAFTGAVRARKGRFELAHRGTLFLDEVGELSPAFQVKLLRVLQEKSFVRVGGEQSISVDVRVISATNRDLRRAIAQGRFREDLYYRLCVVPLELPPLRARLDDIPLLVDGVLEQIRGESGKDLAGVDGPALDLIRGYAWPGNVRELINALRFASVRCDGRVIRAAHLPSEIREGGRRLAPPPPPLAPASARPPRKGKLSVEAVERALAEAGGNKVRAAKALGVGRATLYRFLNSHPGAATG